MKYLYTIIAIWVYCTPSFAQFQLNGNAVQLSTDCYRLTQAINGQSGSVWNTAQVPLNFDFEVLVDINLGSIDAGADGITFAFQQVSSNVGSSGGGLGIQGISPSLFIEFDSYQNGFDPAYDHVALMRNGVVDHTTPNNLAGPFPAVPGFGNIEDGNFHLASIQWTYINASQQNIKVYLDCVLLIDRTDDYINTIFGGNPNVFWGLTASTGGLNNLQQFCFRYVSFLESSLTDTATCEGDSITVGAPPLGSSYIWYPNIGISDSTIQSPSILPDSSRMYFVDIVNVCGISYTDSVFITVLDTQHTVTDTSICIGQSILVGGAFQTIAGTYIDTFQNSNLCDSIVFTNLTILDTTNSFQTVSICEGESYFVGGANQSSSGNYLDVSLNAAGCDSFIYTNLTVIPRTFATVFDTICEGESVFLAGGNQNTSGAYNDTLLNSLNCDSIITTNLYVVDTTITHNDVYICEGESFLAGGSNQSTSGVYTDIIPTLSSCFNTVITHLFVLESTLTVVDTTLCPGESYLAGGQVQTSAGTYNDTLFHFNGCDSLITQTNLNFYPSSVEAQIDGPNQFCIEDSAILQTFIPNVSYYWFPSGETSSAVVVFQGGEYVLQITDEFNCIDSDTIQIEAIEGCYDLFLPTAFSPDGNGINDIFKPIIYPRVFYQIQIFNRWGEKLFESNEPAIGWDGTYKGRPQEVGTYLYKVDYSFRENQGIKQATGNLSLIR